MSIYNFPLILRSLYISLVDDHLNEFSYDADVAGLGYSLTRDADGLFLAAYGFNDKLHVLLAKLVHGMRNHVVKKSLVFTHGQSIIHLESKTEVSFVCFDEYA